MASAGIVLAITGRLLGIAYIGGGIMTLIDVIRGWVPAARGEAARGVGWARCSGGHADVVQWQNFSFPS